MSRTEDFLILDSNPPTTTRDKAKKAARPLHQSAVRRKLADISNLPQNQRLFIREEKSQSIQNSSKEYVHQLQKENMALVKMLAQRNKVIEQSGTELERLRVNMLKMHEQNQQLAQSNSQMLAELNSVENEEEESSKGVKVDVKPEKTEMNSQSKTLDSSEQVQYKEKTENKRASVSRQSARCKDAELKSVEDLFETVDINASTCESAHLDNEDNTGNSGLRYEPQEFGRPSLSRPSRSAAKKVQSYKEIPINIKMRRPA